MFTPVGLGAVMRRGWCRVRVVLAAVLALALLVLPGPMMHGLMAMSVTAGSAGAEHCDHAGPVPADEGPQDHRSLPTCCTAAPCAPTLGVLAALVLSLRTALELRPEATASARAAGLSLPPSVPPPRPAA